MDLGYLLGCRLYCCFFFFNDTATTEIYTLSYTTLFRSRPVRGHRVLAHDGPQGDDLRVGAKVAHDAHGPDGDRKSTRLNSSHGYISYAVFCLKKKKEKVKRIVIRLLH